MTNVQKQELVRLTINLVPRAYAAMLLASEITGDSRTDTVNRAVQLYAYVEHVIKEGGDILIRDKNGETSRIKMLLPVPVSGCQQLQFNAAARSEGRLRPAPRVILTDHLGVQVLPVADRPPQDLLVPVQLDLTLTRIVRAERVQDPLREGLLSFRCLETVPGVLQPFRPPDSVLILHQDR
jgi:hypothetical protein